LCLVPWGEGVANDLFSLLIAQLSGIGPLGGWFSIIYAVPFHVSFFSFVVLFSFFPFLILFFEFYFIVFCISFLISLFPFSLYFLPSKNTKKILLPSMKFSYKTHWPFLCFFSFFIFIILLFTFSYPFHCFCLLSLFCMTFFTFFFLFFCFCF
jgi:hypothetical protein